MPTTDSMGFIVPVIGFVIFVIAVVVCVFFLLTLQKALTRCAPENRKMEPGMVWLMLIPLFNLVWVFFVVTNISASIEAELKKRGIADKPEPTKKIGLAYAILSVCSIIPLVNFLAFIPLLICWIIYWSDVSNYSNKLQETNPPIPAFQPQ
jgi:hypothetical protein